MQAAQKNGPQFQTRQILFKSLTEKRNMFDQEKFSSKRKPQNEIYFSNILQIEILNKLYIG